MPFYDQMSPFQAQKAQKSSSVTPTDLKPASGTTYTVQVRAQGGHSKVSDWSLPITIMCAWTAGAAFQIWNAAFLTTPASTKGAGVCFLGRAVRREMVLENGWVNVQARFVSICNRSVIHATYWFFWIYFKSASLINSKILVFCFGGKFLKSFILTSLRMFA